jgi:ABC-type phosphate transport system permease subunit
MWSFLHWAGVIGGTAGAGRALGETMAVTFIIGNAFRITGRCFLHHDLMAIASTRRVTGCINPA